MKNSNMEKVERGGTPKPPPKTFKGTFSASITIFNKQFLIKPNPNEPHKVEYHHPPDEEGLAIGKLLQNAATAAHFDLSGLKTFLGANVIDELYLQEIAVDARAESASIGIRFDADKVPDFFLNKYNKIFDLEWIAVSAEIQKS